MALGALAACPCTALTDYSQPGPMRVGWRKLLVKPPSGLEFESMVIYPALQLGWEAPQDGSRAPYPLIVFGHGYSTQPDAYMSTLQHLASWGHIVVAPEVPAVHHLRFANDLSMTVSHMEREHERPSGQFYQQVDLAHVGAFGHTVGAGCLLLAAAKDPRVKAMVLLSPLDTMPSSVQAAKEIRVPISLVVAKDEWLASPDKGSVPIYKAAAAPKQLHVVTSGSNAYFYDGEGASRTTQLRLARHLATSFFELYLRRQTSAWVAVWGEDALNNSKVWSVADRGAPGALLRRSPVEAHVEALQEEVFSDPRGSAKLRKEFAPSGPFAVGYTNVTRLTRSRQLFSASVWYPATRAGMDTPLDLSAAPAALLGFGHGWFTAPEGYGTTLSNLASHGYVVVAPHTSNELQPDLYARALSWGIDFLCDQAQLNASRWFGVVDCARVALFGHAIGGAAAALAAAADVRVRALALLSPTGASPSPVEAAKKCHAPLLMLTAPDDVAGGLEKVAVPLYDAAHAPKQLHMMRNGSNHFFSDGMLLGKRHRRQLKETVTLLRSFFDTYLRADAADATRQLSEGAWAAPRLSSHARTVLYDRGFSVALEHGDHDAANATAQHAHNGSSSAPAPPLPPTPPAATGAAVEGADSECRWHISVANTGAERNQLDIGVADNVWTVLAPERSPVLQPGATWRFDVVEQLPISRQKSTDAFRLWLCSRLDGVTCAVVALSCSRERDHELQRVVIDEHGWTA